MLVHELSHLLHPVIDGYDRWLSEGIASYYQNVLRARAGLRSAQWSWDALHAGFERGIRSTQRGRSLAEVSESMMRDHDQAAPRPDSAGGGDMCSDHDRAGTLKGNKWSRAVVIQVWRSSYNRYSSKSSTALWAVVFNREPSRQASTA